MTGTVNTYQFGPADKPWEDGWLADNDEGIYLVADGVTRTAGGGYPNPSPARIAADRFLTIVMQSLKNKPATESSLRKAFDKGNEEIQLLNKELGFWDNSDYWEKDLAGVVCAGIIVRKDFLVWGFLTDSGIGLISPAGELIWHTPDLLTPARKYFISELLKNEKEKTINRRREFRNQPNRSLEKSYGVFTGEASAMEYLRTGTRHLKEGDTVVVYTDGAWPLLQRKDFLSAVAGANFTKTNRLIKQYMSEKPNSDLTLLTVRF